MVLHIPHSSTIIPKYEEYMSKDEKVIEAIEELTDHSTEDLFSFEFCDSIIYPFSRVFCDVEKLIVNEPMEKLGKGILYEVAKESRRYPDKAMETYHKHHKKLLDACSKQLSLFKDVIIVDCHSFSDSQSIEQGYDNSPDICIGFNDEHISEKLIGMVSDTFSKNYSVQYNFPFKGSIVPLELYGKENNIQSIMIEVNKRLYSDEKGYKLLKNTIRKALLEIHEFYW